MNLKTIIDQVGLTQHSGADQAALLEVTGGYAGDLLSEVMANGNPGQLWVTRQVHQNIVAVAVLKELSAVVIIQGAQPDQDTLIKAEKEGLAILSSPLPAFEVIGRIYALLHQG